ncbi:hypothetical protein, partial [Alkalibacterium sp. m-11]
FASDFLQIPPHGGHPCLSLTVPTAKSVVDFHHQVVAHAGRTCKKAARQDSFSQPIILSHFLLLTSWA